MKVSIMPLIYLMMLCVACQSESETVRKEQFPEPKEVTFVTPDSIKMYGDIYEFNKENTILLLFHQGGSNARAEYDPILPRLLAMNLNILAVDQRMGGQIYGQYNRTVAEIPDHSFDNPYGYCDAYNNLESTLDFALDSGFSGKVIVWGSSYSASLAVQLAARRPNDISGVLAFSPAAGGPMQECTPEPYFTRVTVPCLLLRPPGEMESEIGQEQFRRAGENGLDTYVPEYGVHGASMLAADRVGRNVDATWSVVTDFIQRITTEN